MTNVRAAVEKARNPGAAVETALNEGRLQAGPILKAVGIDPSSPIHQAMLLVSSKYGLDPLLGHVMILPKGGKPYVTRDGYLHIAHRSGELDGIEVVDESETPTHYRAKVSVFRKGMSHAFTFTADYPKNGQNREFAKEMALTRAERRALKRAFNVSDIEGEGDVIESPLLAEPEPLKPEPVDVDPEQTPDAAESLPLDGADD